MHFTLPLRIPPFEVRLRDLNGKVGLMREWGLRRESERERSVERREGAGFPIIRPEGWEEGWEERCFGRMSAQRTQLSAMIRSLVALRNCWFGCWPSQSKLSLMMWLTGLSRDGAGGTPGVAELSLRP